MADFLTTTTFFGKTISYYKENSLGSIVGVIALIFCLFITQPQLDYNKEFIQNFTQIGLVIFGFLLTFLSVIIQSDSDSIKMMKKSDLLYSRFIRYNKRIVYLSLLLSVYSYILGYINLDFMMSEKWIDILCISLFFSFLIKLTIDTYTFINLFFLLIDPVKRKKK